MKKQTSRLHQRRSPRLGTTRRRFLQASAAAVSGIALSNCRGAISDPQGAPAEPSSSDASGSSGPLHIYTWADYADEEVYQRFTDQTGIEVISDIYDSNEAMLAKMQAGGGSAYSILFPSDYMVQQMIELDLLTELEHDRIEGLDNLRDRWQDPTYDSGNVHSVPASWGTTGLIYNTETLNPGPEDWSYLWDNKERLSGRITLLEDVRETMGAVLRSLGYSYNSTDPAEIEAAYQRLVEIKPALAGFKSFGWENQLLAGDLLCCMTFSVIGISLALENPALKYIIPKSGSSIWTDTMVIPKSAPNPDAAYAWINFMLEPENSAHAVENLKFATPNQPAFELLSPELQNNTDLFPPEEVIANCEGIAPIGEAVDLYDQYWTELASV